MTAVAPLGLNEWKSACQKAVEAGVLQSACNPLFFIDEGRILSFREPYGGSLKAGQLEIKGDGQL